MEVLIWTRCLNLLTCQFFQSTFLLGQQLTSHKKESASPTLVTLPVRCCWEAEGRAGSWR